MKQSLIIIRKKYRSLAAIVHAMHHSVQRIRSGSARANFDAFRATVASAFAVDRWGKLLLVGRRDLCLNRSDPLSD